MSECPDVKNYKSRLNPVWHRMLYSCTHMATVGVKGLTTHHHLLICDLALQNTQNNVQKATEITDHRKSVKIIVLKLSAIAILLKLTHSTS